MLGARGEPSADHQGAGGVGDHPEGAAIRHARGFSQGAVEPLGQIGEGDLIGEGAPLGDADRARVDALREEPLAPGGEGGAGVGVAVDEDDGGGSRH